MFDYNTDYYTQDKRVGEQLFISGKDAYVECNADLSRFAVYLEESVEEYAKMCGNSAFRTCGSSESDKKAELEFYVGGASDEEAQTNLSNLLNMCKSCVIYKSNDIYEYPAILTGNEVEEPQIENYYLLKLEFVVIRRKPIVQSVITGTTDIFNEGNTPSGVRFRILPIKNVEVVSIFGIAITDLQPNVEYVIDGIEGRVTANGVNYFAHTDIVDFPKVKPGWNSITVSQDVPITVEFYPVYT